MAPLVKRLVARWKLPVLVLEDRAERFDAYDASWLAIAASGTVSLEMALAGLPAITIYRTGPLTAWLARRLIRAPHVNPGQSDPGPTGRPRAVAGRLSC